jgi:hypothetical protein
MSALEELSDQNEQNRLWRSIEADHTEISSLAEVREALFSDSGLGDAMDWSWRQRQGGREVPDVPAIDTRIDDKLVELRNLIERAPPGSTQSVIESPQMGRVREAASELVVMLVAFRANIP